MHDYNIILESAELRLSKVSYDSVQKNVTGSDGAGLH